MAKCLIVIPVLLYQLLLKLFLGPVVMDKAGYTEKGFKRKLAVQALFGKVFYLSEVSGSNTQCDKFVLPFQKHICLL